MTSTSTIMKMSIGGEYILIDDFQEVELMKLNIEDIHIFDERVPQKFKDFIDLHKNDFNKDNSYIFKIIYKAESVLDEEEFDFEHLIYKNVTLKFKNDNKKSTALSIQLEKCRDILKENHIECYNLSIEGECIDKNNVTFILEEDNSNPSYSGRGKNDERITVVAVMPNKKFTTEIISKFYNERMSEIFNKFYEFINMNTEIMCKILEIEYKDDINYIYREFCEQYRNWWVANENKHKELTDKLINRTKLVLGLDDKLK